MASISSLSKSSSSSSIYGNRNVISGLASGMDTEAMIQNSIIGYQKKITALQQRATKTQWKQDAYRNLITQMNSVLSKYTSYTSNTNLFSPSFFSKAINTIAKGANADKVVASGKASSDVVINSVSQLASATRYAVSTDHLLENGGATESIDWNEKIETSAITGSITIQYGGGTNSNYGNISSRGSSFTLSFGDDEIYENAEDLADAINQKLKEQTISSSSGANSADNYIKAEVDEAGRIMLVDKKNNYFSITGVSGGMESLFAKDDKATGGIIPSKTIIREGSLSEKVDRSEYLKDKMLSVTVDGKSKNISMDFLGDEEFKSLMTHQDRSKYMASKLQEELDKAFGKGKVTASVDPTSAALNFTTKDEHSTISVVGGNLTNEALGLGEGGFSNTLQTSWTLGRVLGKDNLDTYFKEKVDEDGKPVLDEDGNPLKVATLKINGIELEFKETDTIRNVLDKINASEAGIDAKYSSLTGRFSLTAKETGADKEIDIEGDLGKKLFGGDPNKKHTGNFNEDYGMYLRPGEKDQLTFKFPGHTLSFQVTAEMSTEDIVNKLNSGSGPLGGEVAYYNKYTGAIEFTDKNGNPIDVTMHQGKEGDPWYDWDLTPPESDITYTKGTDATFNVTVNGETFDMKRSTNTVNLDGMEVTLKGTFEDDGEGVSFTTTADSDKIVDAVKAFVEDYNKMVTDLHNAYSTMPLKRSNGSSYEPLTEDGESSMTETAIKNHEEKAKTGLLFGDMDLQGLYTKLTSAIQGGENMAVLKSIGLEVAYGNGLSTIDLDEDALRKALDTDPDKVKNAFSQTVANGASSNGLMYNLKDVLEQYGNTSIASPGILVNKAGTPLSSYSLSHNELNDQLQNLNKEIESWQDKMSDRIDYYTNQFTRLEQLISQMNSQSSMLAGLAGGY